MLIKTITELEGDKLNQDDLVNSLEEHILKKTNKQIIEKDNILRKEEEARKKKKSLLENKKNEFKSLKEDVLKEEEKREILNTIEVLIKEECLVEVNKRQTINRVLKNLNSFSFSKLKEIKEKLISHLPN